MTQGIGKAFTNVFVQAFIGADQDAIQQQTEQILMDEMSNVEPTTTETAVPMELVNDKWEPTQEGKTAILNAMAGDIAGLQKQLAQSGLLS